MHANRLFVIAFLVNKNRRCIQRLPIQRAAFRDVRRR